MAKTYDQLAAENADLRDRVEDAQATLDAIRTGQVDALVIAAGPKVKKVYTLEGAEHPYRAFVEMMQQGAVTLGGDGTVFYCNRRFAALLQVPVERLLGTPFPNLVHETDHPRLAVLLREVDKGPSHGEVGLQTADGGVLPVYLHLSALALSGGVALSVVVTDLTERKEHEALAEAKRLVADSEARLRFVMDSMPQKIFTAKPTGDVDYFNPQWTAFTGLSFEQIKDWGWTQFIHPDDLAENVRVWRHSIATGAPLQFEHRFRRADGEYRWHISRAVPLRDEADRVVMWIGSNTDIHEQKQTANQLRQYAAELSETDHRKDEFLAMLAHELRNPLAPLRNAAQILRLRAPSDDPALRQAGDMIDRQVSHLVRLVDDLMDVSRITRGKINLRKELVDLAAVVADAVESSRPLIDARGHDLRVTLPAEPLLVEGDATHLTQVLLNLLNNSAKYTPVGGHVELSVERDGGAAILRVRDDGVGIAPELLPKVFDLFTQAERTMDRSQGGLGIGLTLVRRLVELHDGTVEAHSAGVGKGCAFVVYLPLWEQPLSSRAEGKPSAAAATSSASVGRRILVVDDNEDAAESLALLLQMLGHDVRTAHDGHTALRTAREQRPDVLLLDIGLPGLNGYEVARQMRREPGFEETVFVALTGYGGANNRQQSEMSGFIAHLVKPVEIGELQDLLTSLKATGQNLLR